MVSLQLWGIKKERPKGEDQPAGRYEHFENVLNIPNPRTPDEIQGITLLSVPETIASLKD